MLLLGGQCSTEPLHHPASAPPGLSSPGLSSPGCLSGQWRPSAPRSPAPLRPPINGAPRHVAGPEIVRDDHRCRCMVDHNMSQLTTCVCTGLPAR